MIIGTIKRALKMNYGISISVICFILGITGFILHVNILMIQNKATQTITLLSNYDKEDPKISIRQKIPERGDGSLNCWEQSDHTWGAQYDIFIKNNTPYIMKDWVAEMEIPGKYRIDSSWNGEFIAEPEKIIITGNEDSSNLMILPEHEIKIGFVLYTERLLTASNYTIRTSFWKNPVKNVVCALYLGFSSISLIFLISSIFAYIIIRKQEKKSNEKIHGLIKLCASFIDARDEYTRMHSVHVANLSRKIAEKMGFDDEYLETVYNAGLLHDIGKVLIPKKILCKPSPLDSQEWFEMIKHTSYSSEILKDTIEIQEIKDGALYHHERYDGTGYMKIKGEDIPLIARIICVADSYDAMSTDRSYRKHYNKDKIILEIESNIGTQFDPKVAGIMLDLIRKNEIDLPEE